jgi:hypothetical protein
VDKEPLVRLLRQAGAKNIRESSTTGNVQHSCLLGFRHQSGEDNDPSCSVSYKAEHDVSLVKCFACGFEGTFIQYLMMVNRIKEGAFSNLVDEAQKLEEKTPESRIDSVVKKWEAKYSEIQKRKDELQVYDDKELSVFKKVLKKSFLTKKNISIEVARNYDLLWDEKEQRVVIPVRRWDGRLVGCMGRCWCELCQQDKDHTDDRKKHYAYWNFKKSNFLYNEFLINRGEKIFVVEGPFDVMRMASAKQINVVGLMGSSMSEEQAKRIQNYGQSIYLMLDGDAAGSHGTSKAVDLLKGRVVSLHFCSLPSGKDPGDLSDAELQMAMENSRIIL